MNSVNDARSAIPVRDVGNLDGELEKLVIAVALTESFRLHIFANERKLDEICAEGPFKLKGSGIGSFLNFALPSAWGDFPLAVGRAAARSLKGLAEEIATQPEDRDLEEREQPRGAKTLRALELEVESATAEAGALAERAGEMLLTVALLEDGTLREFRSDQARRVLGGKFLSPAALRNCVWVGGDYVPRRWANIPNDFAEVVAMWLSERAQKLWDF